MVRAGELSATVLMPPTTPAAIDTLDANWWRGERAGPAADRTGFIPATRPAPPRSRLPETTELRYHLQPRVGFSDRCDPWSTRT